MSKLSNIKHWKEVTKEELSYWLSGREIEQLKEAKLIIYKDPIDNDYIAESYSMPTVFSETLESLIKDIFEMKLHVPLELEF